MTHKLLIISTVPVTIRSFMLPFIRHFRSLGWQVDGMAKNISTDSTCVSECDFVWDVEWSRNVLDLRNLFVGVPRIKKVIAQGDYDIVHVHTPVAAFVTRYALKNWNKLKKPQVIYTAHGFHFYKAGNRLKNAIFIGLEKLAGPWTDYLITINREDEAAAKKYRLLSPKRIYYTPGIGLDTSYYACNGISEADVLKVRQELNLSPSDLLLLCIAEFTPRKRHQDILNALAKLSCSQVHLALAGDGPLKEEIEKLAAQLGLQKQVHFLGFRSDIPTLIKTSIATVLVSQQEGLPRSIMESFCLATPVIGTKIRGIQDLLAENCGLLVNVGNIDELTGAMAEIVDNPGRLTEMGQRGREKIANYDVKHIIKLYEDIYNLALAEQE